MVRQQRCTALPRTRSAAAGHDLRIRVGVHVGEVDSVGDSVEGVAVHQAARVMAAAEPQEILASQLTASLVAASGIEFEDCGLHQLKGIPGEHRLFAYVEGSSPWRGRGRLSGAGAILAAVTVLGGELAVPCIRNPL